LDPRSFGTGAVAAAVTTHGGALAAAVQLWKLCQREDRAAGGLLEVHAFCTRYMRIDIICWVPNVQVRGVPEDVHRRLKSQAALAGQSLNEFMLARMSDIARVPTVPELAARIRERAPHTGPSSAAVIREGREGR